MRSNIIKAFWTVFKLRRSVKLNWRVRATSLLVLRMICTWSSSPSLAKQSFVSDWVNVFTPTTSLYLVKGVLTRYKCDMLVMFWRNVPRIMFANGQSMHVYVSTPLFNDLTKLSKSLRALPKDKFVKETIGFIISFKINEREGN